MINHSFKKTLLYSVGLAICTVPVITAIILYFPVWKERGAAEALSGFALLLIFIALVPLFSSLKNALRSPAAYTMWFIAFIVFLLLSKIADEMTVISFVGFISNFIGAFFLRAAKKADKEAEGEEQV